jgi:oligoendopeptidase F
MFEGKELSLGEAMPKIADLPLEKRRALHSLVIGKLKDISFFAESEINAVVINKKINDELRGYKNPEDGTILGYENDKKTVDTLTKTVTNNVSISHKFFKLKAKLLKLPHLEYSDRNAGIGENTKEVLFEDGYKTLKSIFGATHPRFAEILESFVKNGQVDVYPKKGKTGGAYCSGQLNVPTFVLLNNTNTFDSVMTFAHEMGHAIHTELSKSQPVFYQGYSISTAEVASTLFESILFDAVFETLSPDEKVIALHNRINDDIQTIFRQVACYNFEREMHTTIRAKGSMSKEDLATVMNKHMASYLGPVVKLTDDDGYYFVGWGHIRRFFYVYSYAFGQIISKSLYAEYKKNPKFIEKILQFLSAGGSASPEDIFKSIGIDVTKPDFFLKGLKSIESC